MGEVIWLPQLIRVIKEHPIIYKDDIPRTGRKFKIALNIAWSEVEKTLGIPRMSCVHLWRNIKLKYAKLKLLFNSGTLSDDIIEAYMETSQYFDGSLSFLDPYLSEITEATIPPWIHKQVNKLFNLTDSNTQTVNNSTSFVTHEQIIRALNKKQKDQEYPDNTDIQHLQNLVENVIKHKLNELFSLNDRIPAPDPGKGFKLELQSELIIEEHVKIEESDHVIEEDFVQPESYDENDKTESKIIPSTDMSDENVCDGPFNLSYNKLIATGVENSMLNNTVVTNDVTVTDDKTKITSQIINESSRISNTNMKKFFNELGEVICIELSKEKQVLLKGRLNALLRNVSQVE